MNAAQLPTILAVDDESSNLLLLQRLLQRYYRVICAPNGQSALDMLAQMSFDLVLLDIMMPGLSGYQVLQKIRANADYAEMPVILISALNDSKDISAGLERGANDYIIKPIDPEVALARVHTQITLKKLQDERKQAMLELQAAQEMKNHLMRIASHDLKGPLQNISMVSSLLRKQKLDIPNAPAWLDALDASTDTMQTVIEDFLDTASLYNTQLDMTLVSVPIQTIVGNLIKQYQVHAARKEITLEMQDCSGRIMADPSRFAQALGNLISNAIKYSPFNTIVRIWTTQEFGQIYVCVADQGPGIPESERDKLFTQFGKLSTRPTDGENSTGLGLWIVKHVVNLQGGDTGVECPPEGGSIFWIQMPSAA
ncbi:MAG: hybrid sensor histidine kinase/response regulator [Anaerolineae bacterium]